VVWEKDKRRKEKGRMNGEKEKSKKNAVLMARLPMLGVSGSMGGKCNSWKGWRGSGVELEPWCESMYISMCLKAWM
jgi:hypothetical protein